MTDFGSVKRSWLAEDGMASEWADPLNDHAAKVWVTQLKLDLETPSVSGQQPQNGSSSGILETQSGNSVAWKPSSHGGYQGVQLEQETDPQVLQALIRKQLERIKDLERALDQSLASLEEVRVQLVDQHFLENQLAATEEIANIQQRAISQLKQQLSQQQQTLESQHIQTEEQTQAFQTLLNVIQTLAEGQQTRLTQLKTQFQLDRLSPFLQIQKEIVDPVPAHSTESLEAQTPQVADLTRQIANLQHVVEQLETELDRTHNELQEQQGVIDSLRRSSNPQLRLHDSSLDQELFTAHCKIQDLETQISKQVTTQAILQHTCQELEQARDRYQTRAAELELQTADMQEQILKQAQQASEYETAIQHWRDRYLKSQDYLQRLKSLVEQSEIHPSDELAELLAAIHLLKDVPEPETSINLSNRASKMDIPEFLARHHRYRVRP